MIWGDKYLVNGLVIDRRFCYDIYLIICIYGFKNFSFIIIISMFIGGRVDY